MLVKLKKISFLILAIFGIGFGQLFALEVQLPGDRAGDDLMIRSDTDIKNIEVNVGEKKINLGTISTSQKGSTRITGNKQTLYNFISEINNYLRWIFGAIAMGLTIYAGYEAITAGGDTKVLKKAMRILIGTAVGLAIAMLSVALVKILVNLNL